MLLCSVPDQGVLGSVPPGNRDFTGRQPSGNLLACRWKVEVLEGGSSSLKSESPRQSPYTDGLIITKVNNGVVL
jgi:hypothetical protein